MKKFSDFEKQKRSKQIGPSVRGNPMSFVASREASAALERPPVDLHRSKVCGWSQAAGGGRRKEKYK